MKSGKASTAVVLLLLATTLPVLAHHSVSAEFDLRSVRDMTGKILQVYWGNPHVYVVIDTKTPNSKTTDVLLWKLQMGSPRCMEKHGIGKNTMVIGTTITVLNAPQSKMGSATAPVFTMIYDNKTIRVVRSPSDPDPVRPAGNPTATLMQNEDPWCAP